MPVPAVQLHHRLAIALDYAGLKPRDMADELDVHRNTVGAYLHGHRSPPRAVLRVWALRCGVPFEWLQHGTATSPTPPNDPSTSGDATPTIWYQPRLVPRLRRVA